MSDETADAFASDADMQRLFYLLYASSPRFLHYRAITQQAPAAARHAYLRATGTSPVTTIAAASRVTAMHDTLIREAFHLSRQSCTRVINYAIEVKRAHWPPSIAYCPMGDIATRR